MSGWGSDVFLSLDLGQALGSHMCVKRAVKWNLSRPDLVLLLTAAAAYYLPRHLAPNPTYPHLYPPYLIRGYPDTAALENRQTIINDYITSQQMHHNAATAMAQRADMLRGLAPRESSLALSYAPGPRGGWTLAVGAEPVPGAWACSGWPGHSVRGMSLPRRAQQGCWKQCDCRKREEGPWPALAGRWGCLWNSSILQRVGGIRATGGAASPKPITTCSHRYH